MQEILFVLPESEFKPRPENSRNIPKVVHGSFGQAFLITVPSHYLFILFISCFSSQQGPKTARIILLISVLSLKQLCERGYIECVVIGLRPPSKLP